MKKIKFSELLKQNNVVIHTPKEKQAKKLFKKLDKLGYKWKNGDSLLNDTRWQSFKEKTYYDFEKTPDGKIDITYCKLFSCEADQLRSVEFKDIDFGNDDPLKKTNTLRIVYIVSMMVLFVSIGASLMLILYLNNKIFFALTIVLSLILIGIGVVAEQKSEDNYDKVHDEEIKNLKLGYEKELAFKKKELDVALEYSLKLERKIFVYEALQDYKNGLPSKEKGTHCFIFKDGKRVMLSEVIEQCKKQEKLLNILKKHTYKDGWSNGYCTHYWKMESNEIKKVKEWFEK